MRTERVSHTTTISLPPPLYREVLKRAKANAMSTSELLREAFRRYLREEREWEEILAYGRSRARKAGVRTEKDVERLIDESRK